jgi:hypothetical protein
LLQDAQRYEDIDKNRYHQKGKPIHGILLAFAPYLFSRLSASPDI